jgi:prophage DNA circulation protein
VADPGDAVGLLEPLPAGAGRVENARDADVVVLFVTARRELEASIDELAAATDMTEDVVRDVALPLGLVDTKVAAIDATWSGLRLVWRRERR